MTIYRFFCDQCNYNKYTSDLSGFVEYSRSKTMKNIPQYDEKQKKTVNATFINLPKKYKCPQCGRLISPKKTNVPEEKTFEPPLDRNET